jgi:tetratricopeptide (TPR) repeat protein
MSRTREEQEARNLEELFERFRQAPDGYAFVPLADACRKMGRIEEALEICDSGVKRHPAYASGHVVRGKCFYDSGNRSGAREAFERVLLLDEHNLVALKYLGMIEADDGNPGAAEKHLRRILSFDPENREIMSILRLVEEQAQIDRTTDEPAATMEAVDELLSEVNPVPAEEEDDEDDSAPALSIEADVVAELPAESPAEEIETSDELASVTLADIFAGQGYASKAAKIYREVLRKQPSNDSIRAKLARLTDDEAEAAVTGGAAIDEAAGLPEIEDSARSEGLVPDASGVADPEGEAGASTRPAQGEGGCPAGAEEAQKSEETDGPDGRISAYPRPEIAEKESLNHFRHWLTKLRR